MEDNNKLGLIPQELSKTYSITKDGETSKVSIEGPKEGYNETVLKYAMHWYGAAARVDHRSRTITVGPVPEGIPLNEAELARLFAAKKTGSILFKLSEETSIAVRVLPSFRSDKRTYKVLYDAIRVDQDYSCTRAQLLKFSKLVTAFRGLKYIDKEYHI